MQLESLADNHSQTNQSVEEEEYEYPEGPQPQAADPVTNADHIHQSQQYIYTNVRKTNTGRNRPTNIHMQPIVHRTFDDDSQRYRPDETSNNAPMVIDIEESLQQEQRGNRR